MASATVGTASTQERALPGTMDIRVAMEGIGAETVVMGAGAARRPRRISGGETSLMVGFLSPAEREAVEGVGVGCEGRAGPGVGVELSTSNPNDDARRTDAGEPGPTEMTLRLLMRSGPSGVCERSGVKRQLTPDNGEVIGALGFVCRGDEVRCECRTDVESRRRTLLGEVALSVPGIWGDVARGMEEEEGETSSGSKVVSRGVMGLGIPGTRI